MKKLIIFPTILLLTVFLLSCVSNRKGLNQHKQKVEQTTGDSQAVPVQILKEVGKEQISTHMESASLKPISRDSLDYWNQSYNRGLDTKDPINFYPEHQINFLGKIKKEFIIMHGEVEYIDSSTVIKDSIPALTPDTIDYVKKSNGETVEVHFLYKGVEDKIYEVIFNAMSDGRFALNANAILTFRNKKYNIPVSISAPTKDSYCRMLFNPRVFNRQKIIKDAGEGKNAQGIRIIEIKD